MSYNTQLPILPPGCQQPNIHGYLSILPSNIQLFDMTPKPIQYQVQMWGMKHKSTKLNIKQQLKFQIRVNANIFGQYLLDSKVSKLIVYDSRNNEQIGSAIINWQLFLRPLGNSLKNKEQNQCPLACSQIFMDLPVINYRKKKVAQISLQINYIKYKYEQPNKNLENLGELQQMYNYEIQNCEKISNNQVTYKQSVIKYQQKNTDQQLVSFTNNKQSSQKIYQKSSNNVSMIKKKSSIIQIQHRNPQISKKQYDYQVQLALLKMNTKGLLTQTNKQYQQQKISAMMIIKSFTPSKANTIVQYMDIIIEQTQNHKQKLRVYPVKNSIFNNQVKIQEGQDIRFIIPKNVRGQFRYERGDSQVKIIGMYNDRNYKIGYLTLQIQSQSIRQYRNNNQYKQQDIKRYPQIIKQTKLKQQLLLDSNNKKNHQQSSLLSNSHQYHAPKIQTYLLITIKNIRHYYIAQPKVYIKDLQFIHPLPSTNIIPHVQLHHSMAIQLRDNQNVTVGSAIVPTFKQFNINPKALNCIIALDSRIQFQQGYIDFQIYVGTMKQINYHLHKSKSITQQSHQIKNYQQPKKNSQINFKNADSNPLKPTNTEKKSSQLSQSVSKVNSILKVDKFNRKRKHYTEVQRLQTQPISQYDRNTIDKIDLKNEDAQQSEEGDPIFLVQIFTRFLHAVRSTDFKPTQYPQVTSRQEFNKLITELLQNQQQSELIDIIMDIFVEEDQVEYTEFLKCNKSYENFLQLLWKLKMEVLTEVAENNKQWESNLNKYSQLGTIKRDVLWKRVFPKTNSLDFRQKFQKIYHITPQSPVNVQAIVNDLHKVHKQPNKLPEILTPQLITDLGRLIRQTIDNNITHDAQFIETSQQKVNIKILCDIFETIRISLSYWESLMVIQQLKSWYNIDYENGEGVISGNTINVWIGSAIRRRKSMENSSMRIETEKSINRSGISEAQKLVEAANIKSKNLSQNQSRFDNQTPNRIHQNKSAVRSQLNEDQIMNIANLLRDNQNYIMHTISSEQKQLHQANLYSIDNKILSDGMILQPSINQSELKLEQQTKYIHIHINELNVKLETFQRLCRIEFNLFKKNSYYFYIKDQNDAVSKQFIGTLQPGWMKQKIGLEINIKNSQGQTTQFPKIFGVLPTDQFKQYKSKTILLYLNSQRVGKINLDIKILNQRPKIHYADQQHNVQIKVAQQSGQICQDNYQIALINQQQISVKAYQKLQNLDDTNRIKLQLPNDYYALSLKLIFSYGHCIIPLEQIYLKTFISGQYPVLAEDGHYINSKVISLYNDENLLVKAVNNKTQSINQSKLSLQSNKTFEKNNYLIIIDYFMSLDPRRIEQEIPQQCLQGQILMKNAISREIISKFPISIQHNINNTYNCTQYYGSNKPNYFTISLQNQIKTTFQFQYNGRPIARGINSIKISPDLPNKKILYTLKYGHNEQIQLQIACRVLQIPSSFSKYKFDRIFRSIAYLPSIVFTQTSEYRSEKLSNTILNKIQQLSNLTITQIKLLKELINLNQINNCFYPTFIKQFFNFNQEIQQLAIEFILNDPSQSGKLTLKKISSILIQIISKLKNRQQQYNINQIKNGYSISDALINDIETNVGLILDQIYKIDGQQEFCDYWLILASLNIQRKQHMSQISLKSNSNELVLKGSSMLKQVSQLCEKITHKYQTRKSKK